MKPEPSAEYGPLVLADSAVIKPGGKMNFHGMLITNPSRESVALYGKGKAVWVGDLKATCFDPSKRTES